MASTIQFRRGNTIQSAAFTGAVGELYVDTDKKTVVVHDGVTAGGNPLPTQDDFGGFATSIINVQNFAQDGYDKANTVGEYTQSAYDFANGASVLAQASFNQANNGLIYSQAVFNSSNTKFSSSGGTVSGSVSITNDLTVSGNLSVLGYNTTVNTTTVLVNDSLIVLANNNTTDAIDIGIVGKYNSGSNLHTGLIRDPATKEWMFFQGYTPEVGTNNLINVSDASFAYANVNSHTVKANLIGKTAVVNGIELGVYSSAAFAAGNTNATNITATNGYAVSAYTQANAATNSAQSAYVQANAATQSAQSAYTQANAATNSAQTAYNQANATNGYATSAFAASNTNSTNITAVNDYATSAYAQANTNSSNISIMQGVNTTQNTNITAVNNFATGAYAAANTKFSSSGGTVSGDLTVTGNISFTGRSSFRVYGTTAATYNSGNKIANAVVDYNQGSNYNNTTGVYTAPVNGLYNVTFNAKANTTSGTQSVVIRKNSLTSSGNVLVYWEMTSPTSTLNHTGVSSVVKLNTGDTVDAYVSSQSIGFDANDSWGVTFLG